MKQRRQSRRHVWSHVKHNESIGRIHNLKQQSDAKTDMDDAMDELERLMQDRLTLQDALKVEIAVHTFNHSTWGFQLC